MVATMVAGRHVLEHRDFALFRPLGHDVLEQDLVRNAS
jgi:hypothetical protein